MDQPGKVANPARGQLNREINIPLSPFVPENLVSRDGFSRPVPRQPAHPHTQAESGAYLRDSSRVPRRRPFMKLPYAIGSVPTVAYCHTHRSETSWYTSSVCLPPKTKLCVFSLSTGTLLGEKQYGNIIVLILGRVVFRTIIMI